jgi:signal transduction histidine kinase
MHIRWWQSIRWRLALGSTLVALLATGLLALAANLAIIQYYGVDQQNRLADLSTANAQSIGTLYAKHGMLQAAVMRIFSRSLATGGIIKSRQGESYLLYVFDRNGNPIYPTLRTLRPSTARNTLSQLVLALHHPNSSNQNINRLRDGVLQAEEGITTPGEIGRSGIGVIRPFIVRPIMSDGPDGGPVVGILVMIPTSAAENTIPQFVAAVGQAVIFASIAVALLAAIAAIIFSQSITRPLSTLTRTARVLASGDYDVRVASDEGGELGELAHTFNEMADQLKRDVEELRRQELWRRELIMNITHDLATPLTAIAGLGESLLDGVNQDREDYEATGRVIVRETLRLRRLVKDLHVMAKMEAGVLPLQRRPLRLAGLADEVLAVLAQEFERANVEPLNAVPYELPLVEADHDMLTRVLSNLCDNALRHTPAGGTVTIEARQVERALLLVSVVDTGEGIAPEALPRVFERFYRADGARQSNTGGSGLGLAIVRAIVEAHGGNVYAANRPGAGAEISFTLPVAKISEQLITQPLGVRNRSIVDVKTMPLS